LEDKVPAVMEYNEATGKPELRHMVRTLASVSMTV
jgi:hypothetical protein